MPDIFNEIDKLHEEINSLRPLDNNLLKQIKEYYRIGLTYTSNALEGNSLTETETKIVIEDGITIGGKPLKDHFEAIGHSEAFDLMYSLARKKSITESDIKNLHRLFYYRIDVGDAGTYRKIKALITGSKYPLPLPADIQELMCRFISNLENMKEQKHTVEFAAIAHKEFVFIHPFVDGNGRVARLLMNLLLLQQGYNIALITPVVRPEYIRSLEKAHENDSDFIEFIASMVKETQKEYLRLFWVR